MKMQSQPMLSLGKPLELGERPLAPMYGNCQPPVTLDPDPSLILTPARRVHPALGGEALTSPAFLFCFNR
jgi:hypothetical protein